MIGARGVCGDSMSQTKEGVVVVVVVLYAVFVYASLCGCGEGFKGCVFCSIFR